ncbi:hypothetical protein A3E42_04015 [Candidatus Gottesmanbacteria bacterium RIFCSPHIGHO2_12_FULL_40_13]|nr:MAG: hypothetical protein A3E42_04015 [Candidatus Gottesmanbacteria bacterium RIFCSPHIGHO2_12_FULL_40_13]
MNSRIFGIGETGFFNGENMKEQSNTMPFSEIKWPQENRVKVGSDLEFVYIMRKDGLFTMTPVAQKMATDYKSGEHILRQNLLEEYDTFFAKLADIIKWGFVSKGNFELHLFDADELDKEVRLKSDTLPIVSLDPLMNQGVFELKVSRGFYLGGKKDYGQVSRPESEALSTQAEKISLILEGQPVCVSEDDIFSGGSLITSLTELLSKRVKIHKVIPGIQVGKPKKLSEMGVKVDPVIEYQTTDGVDIFDKVDLGDPRDYLLGASGLVIKLPTGEYGRAPYILPFVSTTARAGIPKEIEKDFALKVLQANLDFFNNVQDRAGVPLLLKHMDNSFKVMMHQMYGIDPNNEMSLVTKWLMENIDIFWEITEKQGIFHEKLESLKLPQNIVFIDVNGTLFPDKSVDGYIPEEDIESFKLAVSNAGELGLSVGLCSDSPLPQLKKLLEKLDINGPILAENGNILYYSNKTFVLNELPGINGYKKKISLLAAEFGYQQSDDCIAPEFGGKPINSQNFQWAFGANRETSVTVFGPSQLIKKLGSRFNNQNKQYCIDCSPEYNYFAVHPGKNNKLNKGRALKTLSAYGHNIIMIGNSMSDWVEPEYGVICAFVSDAVISPEVSIRAGYIADKPVIRGVIEILKKLK